jgi:hypothetical protein
VHTILTPVSIWVKNGDFILISEKSSLWRANPRNSRRPQNDILDNSVETISNNRSTLADQNMPRLRPGIG